MRRNYRLANPLRRIGYGILPGDSFSYILHLRPREWPVMVAHTSLGYLLAVGLDAELLGRTVGAFLLTLLLWVLLLNGGTLAFNSAFDNDEGDIGYLDVPPPPPRGLATFGLALMFAGLAIAFLLSRRLALVYFVCLVLSIAYSLPPVRLKAVAGADWLINLVGFGALTPLAGWFASDVPMTTHGLLALGGFTMLFAGFYPLTQIYQAAEDAARGDRTIALSLGTSGSLRVALALTAVAFIMFGLAHYSAERHHISLLALLPALLAWLIVLLRWLRGYGAYSDEQHRRGMYAALSAWALTDVAVLVALLI